MGQIDEDALTDYIITQLGKHRRKSDIVAEVCERTGMHWSEAQRFVHDVAYRHRKGVAARQSPLVVVMGAGSIILGLYLILSMLVALVNGENYMLYGVPYLGNVFAMGVGVMLVAGGLIGIWERLKTFFE